MPFRILVVSMVLAAAAQGQAMPVMYVPDLQASLLAPVPHPSGGTRIAVDSGGIVWMATGGALSRWSQAGGYQPTALTGHNPTLGDDGDIYLMDLAYTGPRILRRILPGGQATAVVATWTGPQVSDLAPDGSGGFYLATYSGVWHLPAGAAAPTQVAVGVPGGVNTSVMYDPAAGNLWAGDNSVTVLVTGPSSSVTRFTAAISPPPWTFFLTELAAGWYGHALLFEVFVEHVVAGTLHAVRPSGGSVRIASFPSVWGIFDESYPALAKDPSGGCVILSQGALYRISGSPILVTIAEPAPGTIALGVDGPPGLPFIFAADLTPNLALTYSGTATFHTSLGLLPTFMIIADGVGAFEPPHPGATFPWTLTGPTPYLPGVIATLEAYAPGPAAANSWLHISNVVVRPL